jgi:hypothetical protein
MQALYAASADDFELEIVPSEAEVPAAGGSADFDLVLKTAVDGCQGWQLGVLMEPGPDVTASFASLEPGGVLATIKDGERPGFEALNWYTSPSTQGDPGTCAAGCPSLPEGAIGFTQGITIDLFAAVTLPASPDGVVIVEFSVQAQGPVDGVAEIAFSDIVGDPVIETAVVFGGGSFKPAVQEGATVRLIEAQCVPPAQYTLEIAGGTGDTNDLVESVVTLNFDDDPGDPNPDQIQGWSYGICVTDTAKLRPVSAVIDGTMTATSRNGGAPDFSVISIFPEGVTHGVSLALEEPLVTIDPQNGWTDLVVTYEVLMTEDDDFVHVTPCSGALGVPPLRNVMSVQGRSVLMSGFEGIDPADPVTGCCNVESCNQPGLFTFLGGASFVPGSANGDGRLNLADPIYLWQFLFAQGPLLPCEKAGDTNGDCVLDSSDGVLAFEYLFMEGPPPAYGLGCQFVRGSVCRELTCEVSECEP